jgi:hypothetical protein
MTDQEEKIEMPMTEIADRIFDLFCLENKITDKHAKEIKGILIESLNHEFSAGAKSEREKIDKILKAEGITIGYTELPEGISQKISKI